MIFLHTSQTAAFVKKNSIKTFTFVQFVRKISVKNVH